MCNQFKAYSAKSLLGFCLTASVLCPAFAQDSGAGNIRWKSIIGIIMPGNVVGSGNTAITGGGQPWSVTRGDASVDLHNGDVDFDVRGLVFAGGNSIGTPGTVTSVKGTLICDTNGDSPKSGGNSQVFDTVAVELDAEGDAEFKGSFDADLGVCSTEAGSDMAFLIRSATSGNWFANGAVLLRHGKDE